MRKRLRRVRALAESAGLSVVDIDPGRRHLAIKVRNAAGQTRQFFVAQTPGDVRGDGNARALFRQFARGRED